MLRDVSLSDITDGRFYGLNDMVKVGTGDCAGCSGCCRVTGDTIKLDPWDVWCLTKATGKSFELLIAEGYIELQVVEGVILPNIKQKEGKGCPFLNSEGRCSIHDLRPGFCRLFPLGRYYDEEGKASYVLQIHECPNAKIKMKVKKWIDLPDVQRHEDFAIKWHLFIRSLAGTLENADPETRKARCMEVLETMYLKPYETEDFYEEAENRLQA